MLTVLASILSLSVTVPPQTDTAVFSALDSRIEQYCEALATQPAGVKSTEADAVIEFCTDSLLRQRTALRFYDYYLNSKLMGDETVAVHLVDTWFSSGRIKMKSDLDLINARVYAEFNRNTLLGMEAPRVTLEDESGAAVTVPGNGRYSILYFYDTGCSTCRAETPVLMNLMSRNLYPVDFYAIYVGSSREAWTSYVKDNLSNATYNLWDEDKSSDIQRLYGVLQTPRLLVTDKYGKIVGRGLDPEALVKVLENEFRLRSYEYGQKSSMEKLDALLSEGFGVKDFASYIYSKTLEEQKDTVAYKMLMGDLLYWTVERRGHELESAEISDEYILGADPKIWCDPWDSLKVGGLAVLRSTLAKMSPVGSRVPSVKVLSGGRKVDISRTKDAYLLFHTSGCKVCEQTLEKTSGTDVRVVEINMDAQKPKVRFRLLESFDISVMPLIVRVEKGIVKEQYVKEIL